MTSIGQSIRDSPAIAKAFETVLAEISSKTASITDIKGPDADLVQSYEDTCRRAGESRGKGLLYPYLGSGAGNGALVELGDGSVKWDLVAGIGVNFFGHSHPEILKAQLDASLGDTTKHGNLQAGTEPYAFAEKLVSLASRNSGLRHAFLTPNGVMANESAFKACLQKHSPADRIIAFKHCFMGRSLTMTSIGDSAGGRDGIPINQAVDYMPFWNDIGAEKMGGTKKFIDWAGWQLQSYIDRYPGRHACFVMELVQGEGGFNTPKRDFLLELMKICKANNIAVWDDEIQAFGRTTEMFAYETFDLGEYVDVFCVGKMTQACAAMFTPEYNPRPGLLSGTFSGATADFTTGLRVLEMLDDGAYYGDEGLFNQHHNAFRAQVDALVARHPDWFPTSRYVREFGGGIGGMMRMTPFGGDKTKIIAAAKAIYDEGAVAFWCGHGPYHLRMLPPLPVLTLDQWPKIFEVLERGLARVAG